MKNIITFASLLILVGCSQSIPVPKFAEAANALVDVVAQVEDFRASAQYIKEQLEQGNYDEAYEAARDLYLEYKNFEGVEGLDSVEALIAALELR